MSLIDQVRAQLRRFSSNSGGMIVAVSGGADSVAMLHALRRIDSGPAPLLVAHLNHGLRNVESDADESFVRDMCSAFEPPIAFLSRKLDVAAVAAHTKGNLEATARKMRYDWFGELAEQMGVTRVATGHTADDQAETVLHRLIRGAGLRGLRGILPSRRLRPGVDVIRPLLTATRTEVRQFLADIGQPYREDRSNREMRYTRNRLRHELLPLLARDYNPAIVAQLAELAEQSQDAFSVIEAEAGKVLKQCELPPAGALRILDRERLGREPRHLINETLRCLWQREGWPAGGMTRADWDRAAAVVVEELAAVDLPGGIRIRGRHKVVQIGPPDFAVR